MIPSPRFEFAGVSVERIASTMFATLSDTGVESEYDKAEEKITEYFAPKTTSFAKLPSNLVKAL